MFLVGTWAYGVGVLGMKKPMAFEAHGLGEGGLGSCLGKRVDYEMVNR